MPPLAARTPPTPFTAPPQKSHVIRLPENSTPPTNVAIPTVWFQSLKGLHGIMCDISGQPPRYPDAAHPTPRPRTRRPPTPGPWTPPGPPLHRPTQKSHVIRLPENSTPPTNVAIPTILFQSLKGLHGIMCDIFRQPPRYSDAARPTPRPRTRRPPTPPFTTPPQKSHVNRLPENSTPPTNVAIPTVWFQSLKGLHGIMCDISGQPRPTVPAHAHTRQHPNAAPHYQTPGHPPPRPGLVTRERPPNAPASPTPPSPPPPQKSHVIRLPENSTPPTNVAIPTV